MEAYFASHPKLKALVRTLLYTVLFFIGIYLMVLFGLWQVFAEKNVLGMEGIAAFVLAVLCSAMDELYGRQAERIRQLEERVSQLEAAGKAQDTSVL